MSGQFQPKGERGRWFYQSGLYDPATMPSYEIGMEEWRTAQTSLMTTSVVTCVMVAATNVDWRTALLGHFAAPDKASRDSQPELFEHAIAELSKLGPPEATRICLAGAGILPSDTDPEKARLERKRTYSETYVRNAARAARIPENAVAVEWLHNHFYLAARVNPHLGNITVKSFQPL